MPSFSRSASRRLLPALILGLLLPLSLLGQGTSQPAPASAPATGATATAPAQSRGSLAAARAAAPDTTRPKSRADTVLVVKHQFDHREQIITGSVVMTCLALMMVIMNNYNPR